MFLGLLASGLAGLFAMGIFFKRIHGRGAIIGFLGSSLLLIYLKMNSPVSFLLYGFIGFTSSIIIAYLASLIIPGKRKSIDGLTIRTVYDSKKKYNNSK
jgi:SSS family solute:Na+ symporter